MTELNINPFFVTPIGAIALGVPGLVGELKDAIWMLEEGDEAGARWCADNGYDGYTSYASLDDLPERASAFAALKTELDQMASAFAGHLHWDLSAHRLRLDSLWVNILGEGGAHSGHIHPGSVISGTVYIDMPDGAGALKFEDPRLGMMQAAPPLQDHVPEATRRFVYRTPEAGTVLLWESWLRHEVMPNKSDVPRLSISFNYGLVDK
jgi:uncharacterized protein (TIGR02466 family)